MFSDGEWKKFLEVIFAGGFVVGVLVTLAAVGLWVWLS